MEKSNKGWRNESIRHGLSAKGVQTAPKKDDSDKLRINPQTPVIDPVVTKKPPAKDYQVTVSNKEKERVMRDFKDKKIDVLVSTSVVEVGVDIPNATVMMIEGSEKFGLAQLHQFRGRVGRSEYQSYCFLFTDAPGMVYNRRLRALISCENGFELAEKDLAIRGPGDFTGQRQWGIPDLVMASLADTILVSKARNDAKELLQEDPQLKKYPLMRRKLEEFQKKIHLE